MLKSALFYTRVLFGFAQQFDVKIRDPLGVFLSAKTTEPKNSPIQFFFQNRRKKTYGEMQKGGNFAKWGGGILFFSHYLSILIKNVTN